MADSFGMAFALANLVPQNIFHLARNYIWIFSKIFLALVDLVCIIRTEERKRELKMLNVNDSISATYDDGETYTGAVEKIRQFGNRTLVTIAIPVRDYADDGRPVTVWKYRSLYLDRCVSVNHVDPQEVF